MVWYSQPVCLFAASGDSLANAARSFGFHNGQRFSAWDCDRDQDSYSGYNCARMKKGGWWYNGCMISNLNGRYLAGGSSAQGQGILWYSWKGDSYSLKRAEMKIRPNQ